MRILKGSLSLWNVFDPEVQTKKSRREVALLSLAFAFLCLMAVGLTLSAAARVQNWGAFPGILRQLIVLPIWGVSAWLLHREANRVIPNRDPFLLPTALLLSGWGALMIWRLNPAFGLRQTLWLSLGCLLILGLFRVDPKLSWLRNYRYLWMSLALALLGLTLIFGTNPLGGEPRLWLGCCGVYFQPSEPLRFFLVAFLASYLGDRLRLNGAIRTRLPWRDFLPLLIVWGIAVLLLVVQRDLGTGMIFLALLAILLFLATGSWQALLFSLLVAVSGGVLSYFLFDVVQIRVEAWLNPWLDPSGSSYQIVQSLISIASGGIVGRGPGLGSPAFVPASHTDFIFSAITEEFGLVGAVAMLALFAVFVSRGLKVARSNSNVFARFLAAGLTLAIGLQAIFIIGGVTRALPLVGITLPFVSYGGSSFLTSSAALAILLLLSEPEGMDPNRFHVFDTIQVGFSLAWCALALVAAWWTIYRAPTLVARSDNPRRSLDSRFVERGAILDRNGIVLAESIGTAGAFDRAYHYAQAAPVTGFDSSIYGQAGIESSMDTTLRGLERGTLLDNTWQRLVTGHPPEGEDISLTIDIRLQSLAMDLLAGRTGAAVLLEARSGDLYVIASQPSYNPDLIEELWGELVREQDAPLFNRATQGLYQPGLTMAPFLFAQANAAGELEGDDRVGNMSSAISVDGETLTCSLAPPGTIERTLASALRYGCPQPMQQTFVETGWDTFHSAVVSFGFTQQVDIRLDTAESVFLEDEPSQSELAQFVIGQGDLRVSPLQMARAFGGLVADDERAPLRLVSAVNYDDEGWEEQESVGYRVPPFSSEVIGTLQGIYAVGNSNLTDLRAQALSGSEGQRLGWYLGALDAEEVLWVVVVTLEGGAPQEAEGIGRAILTAAGGLTP